MTSAHADDAVSTGGEYGGAATFMAEYAPDRKRGRFGSFLEFGTLAGFTLGATLVLITELVVGADNMADRGWRLPFLVAAPMGSSGSTCAAEIGLSSRASLILIIIGQTAMMLVIPFSGALSDRVGHKTMWWIGTVGLFVLSIPLFKLMGAGFAIAYNVSTSLFGGTARAVNQALINASGDKLMPAYYLMAACVVGAIALWFVPETRACSLRGDGIPGIDTKPQGEPVELDAGFDLECAPRRTVAVWHQLTSTRSARGSGPPARPRRSSPVST
jgi:MHS family proline/betaine transporter-like MFS transporter